jgi:hypothetical protein
MGWKIWMGLAAATLSLAGCGGAQEEFSDGVPSLDDVSVELTDETQLEGSVSQGLESADGGGTFTPEYLAQARAEIHALNERLREALAPLHALVKEALPRMERGDTRVFGPRDHGDATYRLTVRKLGVGDFGWRLEAKEQGADDSTFQRVAGGATQNDLSRGARRGGVAVDLTLLGTLDSTVLGRGRVFMGFARRPAGKTLVARLQGYTPDPATHPDTLDYVLSAFRLDNGVRRVRLAGQANIEMPQGTAAEEHFRSIVRFVPGIGGRADVRIIDGDVPAGKFRIGRACWTAGGESFSRLLLECTTGVGLPSPQTCTVLVREPAATELSVRCPMPLRDDLTPPANDDLVTPEDGAPDADVVPPPAMPGDL